MSRVYKLAGVGMAILAILTLAPMALASTQTAAAKSQVKELVVSNQRAKNGTVTIAYAESDGAGWIVIHRVVNGQPEAVIGYAPLKNGANRNVVVKIDAAKATSTLIAMIHKDAGKIGTFEFPGVDAPAKESGAITMASFILRPAVASQPESPELVVHNQKIANSTITIASVESDGAGWIVIHQDVNGKPGAVIGFAHLNRGVNNNVVVKIDTAKATPTLFAMIHKDAGKFGTFEFPGVDAPSMEGGHMLMATFTASAS